ncbi:response regulator transcription factor [Kribbella albertanoniae]|uniref:Response regulator transcription factor n=1 Tax=Kribbella albertanoniae TaxID=1266829 RepID=A0A4R4QER4_9ACTN|nr:response regulator transcription factor [Kribbella albertanoniae]TDC33653.1 response regulator transcription factor [Kribbella albertanoniae]
MTRLVIADDHPIVRNGLRDLLLSVGGMDIVAEAATGDEAVQKALRYRPDVVLMDLQMPGLNGISATQEIVAADPAIAVVVLSMFEEDDSVLAAVRAGARGYLLKGGPQEDIIQAVHGVATGAAFFGRRVAGKVMELLAGPPPAEAFPDLTGRERDVLDLIAAGLSNIQIARQLHLAPKTVSNNISNIFAKLRIADRAAAIECARAVGLGRAAGPLR